MATNIPNVPTYDGEVPLIGQGEAEFSQNAQDSLQFQAELPVNLNDTVDAINTVAGEIEGESQAAQDAAAAAESNANFKGNWSDLTGALSIPASVRHNGDTWQLLVNLADVTASEPGITSDWKNLNDYGSITSGVTVKHRRGTNAEILAGTPAIGELWFNTTDNSIHMGDGVTPGGVKHINKNMVIVSFDSFADMIANAKNMSPSAGVRFKTGSTLWLVTDDISDNPLTGTSPQLYVKPIGDVDIRDFNAVVDGTTDDSTSVNNADEAARPYGVSNVTSAVENFYGLELSPKALMQDNVSGRLYNPKASLSNYMFGMETLQHWFGIFADASNKNSPNLTTAKIVCTGDSTTFGVGGTYGGVPAILNVLAQNRGYPNVSVVNNGQSAQATIPWPATGLTNSWKTTYLAQDIAEDPDLLIVRWGANDPFYNVAPLGDSNGSPVDDADTVLKKVIQGYRETLTLLRNSAGMDVENLSVILVSPGPMNDVFFGRDEVYFQRLSVAMKQMALDFQCAFVDAYGLFSNSWGGTDFWYDADATSGTLRSIHPHDVLYEHIAAAIAEVALPNHGIDWQTNQVRNNSATSGSIQDSTSPSSIVAGINVGRIGDGFGDSKGKPYNGIHTSIKQADGSILQLSYPLNSTGGAGISAKIGWSGTWNDYWNGAVYLVKDLTYQNGWSDFGSGFEEGNYKLSLDGTVTMGGVLSVGTTTAGTVLFTLPAGFRPPNTVICHVGTETADCLLLVGTNGDVSIQRYTGGSYIMLNSVRFSVY